MNLRVPCATASPVRWLGVILILVFGLGALTERPRAQAQPQPQRTPPGGVETLQIRPNVYLLAGAGANIVVHVGWMGVVLVDTGSANMSDQVLAAIQRITDQRIRFIINTTADADHVGGNAPLARAGRTLLRYNADGGFGGNDFQTNGGAAGVMAQENVLTRMSATVGDKPAFPGEGWPTEAFTGARVKSLYLNGDGVQIFHQPNAHSDGDSIVVFRRADVIAAGPIVDLRTFPVIDLERGNGLATSALTDWVLAFVNEVVTLLGPGAEPIVYTTSSYAVGELDSRVANLDLGSARPEASGLFGG